MLAKDLVKICPFWSNKDNKIKSPLRMILDRVLVWRPPNPEKIGLIYLPDVAQEIKNMQTKPALAVVLSVGPGYSDNKRFYPTFIKPEWVVLFHSSDLWTINVRTDDGKSHQLNYMGEKDVKVMVDPDQELDELSDILIKKKYFIN